MMKKTIAISGLAASALLLTACASNPTSVAVQKENNQFEVTGLGKNQLTSKNNAVNAASKTCGSKATAIILDEKTSYDGCGTIASLAPVREANKKNRIKSKLSISGEVKERQNGENVLEPTDTITLPTV